MVTCPRCEQPVDETVRTTCPLCFTPIQTQAAAPQIPALPPNGSAVNPPSQGFAPPVPQGLGGLGDISPQSGGMPGLSPPTAPQRPAAPPMANPGARVSLTGEVIDSGMSSGPPPSYVGGGAAVPQGPRPAGPTTPHGSVPLSRRQAAEAPAKSGGGAIAAVVVVIVLLLAAAAGWYLMMHRTNPKDQALTFYKAFLSQDWKTVYPLVAFSEDDKKKYPDAETFASETQKQIDGNPLAAQILGQLKTAASTAAVGEPVVTGDKADVPTSVKMSTPVGELTFKGTAHMINESGIWKFDSSNGSGGAFKSSQDLIGKPEGSGGAGIRLPGK